MTRIAIHGFGRIVRVALRAALNGDLFTPVAVSDIRAASILAALFEVDSNNGRRPEKVAHTEDGFTVGSREIGYYNTGETLPDSGEMGIDLVIDCTGGATVRSGAQAHLDRGRSGCWSARPGKALMTATPC